METTQEEKKKAMNKRWENVRVLADQLKRASTYEYGGNTDIQSVTHGRAAKLGY